MRNVQKIKFCKIILSLVDFVHWGCWDNYSEICREEDPENASQEYHSPSPLVTFTCLYSYIAYIAIFAVKNIRKCVPGTEMQKVGDTGDISPLFFLAGANFWAILGNFWAILAFLGHFWAILAILGHFWAILGKFG